MATIYGTPGADQRNGTDTADTIYGGATSSPASDAANDTLYGGLGNDLLLGFGGDDSLDGGNDNDTQDGGDGNDTLYGDSGSNTFLGGAGDDTVQADNIGTIASFNGGTGADTLLLLFDTEIPSTAIFTSVERIDRVGNAVIKGDNNGNTLDFTGYATFQDGSAAGLRVFGAGGNDTITGAALGDTLEGAAGDDVLNGGAGDDSLSGGTGTNTLSGGDGNDTLVGDNVGSIGSFNGGTGTDTLFLGFDITLDSSARLVSIERVETNGNHLIQGNSANNVLDFSTYAGSNGGLAAGLNLSGNAGNDTVSGTALGDTIDGGTGNDTLIGGAGDDRLDGSSGTDSLVGGAGNDTYRLESDANIDVVVEAAREGTDTVEAGFTYTLGANLENLTLLFEGNINGIGNGFANQITGNTGNNLLNGGGRDDTLDGAGGNDILVGGTGSDLLLGGEGTDKLYGGAGDTLRGGTGDDAYIVTEAGCIVDETGGDGYDSVTASVSFTLADGVERLTQTGTAGLSGTGGADANRITGNAGANLLSGAGGNDMIQGGAGDDTIVGGAGADRLYGDAGLDTFRYASAAEGRDVITGFAAVDDGIEVSAAGFGGGLAQGALAANRFVSNETGLATAGFGQFIYETDVASLWWDADGTGSGARLLIATLTGAPALTAADISVFA
ncbi:beta strand repeat-containing protein [Roseomonas sp. CCTCC AB2023176]|uniref:beta strand repeat-containing protein n=1 Tax=Roseomonas sp. CCTCC AB2023176 TaxID=3342640 RepID=UPI0035DCC64E